jgi:hypothetical protein
VECADGALEAALKMKKLPLDKLPIATVHTPGPAPGPFKGSSCS